MLVDNGKKRFVGSWYIEDGGRLCEVMNKTYCYPLRDHGEVVRKYKIRKHGDPIPVVTFRRFVSGKVAGLEGISRRPTFPWPTYD